MRQLYIILGFIFMILGSIGIVIPILPTTPFLLLASYCFAKGSERFDEWFKGTNLYINYLKDFDENRSMTLKTKIRIVSFASLMLILAMIMTDVLFVKVVILGVVAFLYYYFTFHIQTIKE